MFKVMVEERPDRCKRAKIQHMTDTETIRCMGAARAVTEERATPETFQDVIRQMGDTERYLMEGIQSTEAAVEAIAEDI